MSSWFKKQLNGLKLYYKRDGLKGMAYYVNHRLYNRIAKPLIHSDMWIPFSAERRLAKRFEHTLPSVDGDNFIKMGNYVIFDDKSLGAESVVYSLGVLTNVEFDEAITKTFDCPVFMFDPSNIARDYLNYVNNPRFIFKQVGIWNETVDMHFTTPKYGGSPSMIAHHDGKQFSHKCIDIKEIIQEYGHDKIDIFKMDVEGAAFTILERLIDIQVYPKQIIAEFERMNRRNVRNFFLFYSRLMALIEKLETLGYVVYAIPRDKYKYFSIELIFVNASRICKNSND